MNKKQGENTNLTTLNKFLKKKHERNMTYYFKKMEMEDIFWRRNVNIQHVFLQSNNEYVK